MVAVAPIKIKVPSSIPKVEPNRKLFSGMAEPAEDKMKIPSANDIKYKEASEASSFIIVRRAKNDVQEATITPAIIPPINMETTDKPAITNAMTIPGTMACAMASPASDKRRKTKKAPIGEIDRLRIEVATKALCINSNSRNARDRLMI